MPHPLDEHPIHQAPLSMAHVVSSDRNAYDRYYFNAHGRSADPFCVFGLGVYPNLGVADAFFTFGRPSEQVTVRASDALDGVDRMHPAVGPFRVEVIEPLQRLRFIAEAEEHGLGVDLTWTGSFPAVDESPHHWRSGGRVTLDAQRFAQTGTWEGEIELDGVSHVVDPAVWMGTRDRSWGIRPSGDPEPAGRAGDEPIDGFWWLYVPVAFPDFQIVVIVQEEPDGFRVVNDALRIDRSDPTKVEQLGWPRVDICYRSGTRHPVGATITLTEPDGTPLVLEVETQGFVALNAGPGYGGDHSGWAHGAWRGRGWSERVDLAMDDPGVASMVPFSVVDHIGRAKFGDQEGWGLFEHGTFGRHDPSGFADWSSVAP